MTPTMTPTPETNAIGKEIGQILADCDPLPLQCQRLQELVDTKIAKLEHERDAADRLIISNDLKRLKQLSGMQIERDLQCNLKHKLISEVLQLRQICDELVKYQGMLIYCHGGQLALQNYSDFLISKANK